MAIPGVSEKRILEATQEFDKNMRGTAEWSGWEEKHLQHYALKVGDKKYPPKQIVAMATGLHVNAFHGGRETNSYLEARGYTVVKLQVAQLQGMLENILGGYSAARAQEQFGSNAPMYQLFQACAGVMRSEDILGDRQSIKVKASCGQGNWAKVPWIAFLDNRETDTTQKGVYVVILFAQDGSRVYLTLNQGVTEPIDRHGQRGGANWLMQNAQKIRQQQEVQHLTRLGFRLDDDTDLADPGMGEAYEKSTIAYKSYDRGKVPDDAQLIEDMNALLSAYGAYVATGHQPEGAGMHILLRWAGKAGFDTIDLHKQIAERSGSVWWGKWGRSPVGIERLGVIRSQLARGEKTFVFLFGEGTHWKTELLEITNSPDEVDDQFKPSYYQKTDCAAFFKLSNFEKLQPDWLNDNAVLASDPKPGSVSDGLKGQASLFYIKLTDASRDICLIGTSRNIDSWILLADESIKRSGGWASNWSFPVKDDAAKKMRKPFHLYVNTGGAQIKYKLTVEDYMSQAGSQGIVSPWPELTEPGKRDIARDGESQNDINKTWLKVVAYERLSPALPISNFKAVPGLSSEGGLLNQSGFGYAYFEPNNADEEQPVSSELTNLANKTNLSEEKLGEILEALRNSKQVVLAGPPGTSKTFVARAIAEYVAKDVARTRFVQFHPNYSYEAFIEGLRPEAAPGGGIEFKTRPGVVVELADLMRNKGESESDSPAYVVVIDEMNRANLPRVFGELMFLFEYRDQPVRLQYTENFKLPPNMFFLATMNTADRSIRSIDVALRRRFEMFELGPDSAVLEKVYASKGIAAENVVKGFERLNKDLKEQLDRHHTIGHAYFLGSDGSAKSIKAIWDRKISPLIEEYFFDQPDIAKSYSLDKYWPDAV